VSEPHVPPPDPGGIDDSRGANAPGDYLSEDDLRDLGIDPGLVPIACPWAVELTGHGGVRCWAAADLAPLLEGGVL
jgi:hypothetical protein